MTTNTNRKDARKYNSVEDKTEEDGADEERGEETKEPSEPKVIREEGDMIQSEQWDTLTMFWPGLTILSGISAILSAVIFQYVLAIVNAATFFLGFFCFLTSFFRFEIVALILMVFAFGSFALNSYFVVSLMTDFYDCASDGCADWRLFPFQINFIFVAFLCGFLVLTFRQCYILLLDYRDIYYSKLEKPKKEGKKV